MISFNSLPLGQWQGLLWQQYATTFITNTSLLMMLLLKQPFSFLPRYIPPTPFPLNQAITSLTLKHWQLDSASISHYFFLSFFFFWVVWRVYFTKCPADYKCYNLLICIITKLVLQWFDVWHFDQILQRYWLFHITAQPWY